MSLYPGAEWRPLESENPSTRMKAHDVVCVHTMVGSLAGTDSLFRKEGWRGNESHFGVGGSTDSGQDGSVYQWVDTDFQADCNLQGNARLISIETSDGGDETIPWSSAQLEAIVNIIVWCCRTYQIPANLVADSAPGRRGIGYHRQGIDPWRVPEGEKWSDKYGKVCPGDIRIAQLIEEVIPRAQHQLSEPGFPEPQLQVHSINPDGGFAGSQVILSGAGFNGATGVSFGDVWVDSWSIDNDNQITVTVPNPLTSGSVSVTVVSEDTTSEGVSFTYEE